MGLRLPAAFIILPAALLVSACQPQARRLLVIDEQLSGAGQLAATARPWRDAGYTVAYRRYYPHLTRADLDDYRVVMVLGGMAPEANSDALSAGDLTILTEWTLHGGVVVLGYPPAGPGTLDRWLMNRWLAWSGAGIAITAGGLLDATSLATRESGVRGVGFDPFYAGANDALRVSARAQVLARTAAAAQPMAVVAASRTGDGLIVVTSRSFLAALGGRDDAGTRDFLVALARWTRRPAEWARIPSAGRRTALVLRGGPAVPSPRPPALAAPAGVPIETLPPPLARAPAPDTRTATNRLPSWLDRQGLRVLTGDFPGLAAGRPYAVRAAALDSMLGFMDAGGFNILMTNAHAAAIAESARGLPWEREALRNNWKHLTTRLGSTSIRWVPLVTPREFRYAKGDSTHCPLDSAFWAEGMTATVRTLARLAQQHTDLIPGLGIDLDETTRPWATPTFCDAAWHAALVVLVRDTVILGARARGLDSVPLASRYDSLLEGGLLAQYNGALARAVTERAAALRADARRIRRDLLFAVVASRSPDDWFSASLLRGLAGPAPEPPLVLLSPQPRPDALADINLVNAVQLDPLALPSPRAVWHATDGFWLGPAERLPLGNDSIGRAIRRLALPRPPAVR